MSRDCENCKTTLPSTTAKWMLYCRKCYFDMKRKKYFEDDAKCSIIIDSDDDT